MDRTHRSAKPAPAWSGIARARLGGSGSGRSYAKSVGAFVPGLTRKAFEKFGFSTATLIMDWPRIAGADLAQWTAPEKVRWPQGVDGSVEAEGRPGATLVLRVDPARALDVEYRARQIVERINSYFGYRAISELRLLQAPLTANPAPQALTRVQPAECRPSSYGEEPLGRALARLEAGVRAARRSP